MPVRVRRISSSVAALAAAAALALCGCSSSDSSPPDGAPTGGPAPVAACGVDISTGATAPRFAPHAPILTTWGVILPTASAAPRTTQYAGLLSRALSRQGLTARVEYASVQSGVEVT